MAYHIYHSEALFLGGRSSGEGDKMLYCYTRELGLVSAHVRSVRELRSRLRYVLQTFAHAEVDLIRGKHGWKLISARPINSFSELWKDPEKRAIIAQHTHLLRRLIQGEEPQFALFDDLLQSLELLSRVDDKKELRSLELLFVVRLLNQLGYWGEDEARSELFLDEVWKDRNIFQMIEEKRVSLISGINRALRETQL